MEKKKSVWRWILPLILFAALMTVFAFADLEISKKLVDMDSAFGKFAERSGEIPFDLFTMFAYAVLLVTRVEKKTVWTVLAMILFFAGTFEYAFFVLFYFFKYPGYSWAAIAGAVGAVPFGIVAILLAKRLTKTHRDTLVKAAVIVVVAVLLQEAFVNIIKIIWARPRMRDLSAPYTDFVPWYLPRVSALGGDSFPSGHTARAAGSFFPVLLCGVYEKLKNKSWIFLLFGAFWTCMIGIGRIVLAAHFASDVTAGAFLMLLSLALSRMVTDSVYRKRSKPAVQTGA